MKFSHHTPVKGFLHTYCSSCGLQVTAGGQRSTTMCIGTSALGPYYSGLFKQMVRAKDIDVLDDHIVLYAPKHKILETSGFVVRKFIVKRNIYIHYRDLNDSTCMLLHLLSMSTQDV